ncbi:MAG: NUDIX hydrolase [Myxococcaceae bacterium]|nr:NUDIX hydrolase [Myxococcaceae bacterium]
MRDEKAFLTAYRATDYPRPSVAVDLVILTIIDAQLRVLLVKRREHPFKGQWALPGGFVRVGETATEQGEDLDEAARRELREETGLDPQRVFLEQLYTFGKAGRDPRMRVISVAYYALVRPDLAPFVKAGGDVSDVEWFDVAQLPRLELAFDHHDVVDMALARIRGKLEYANIAFDLVPATFTIPELRHVYGIVLGRPMDPGNFRRSFNRWVQEGRIEQAPGKRITTSKPAAVFRFKR